MEITEYNHARDMTITFENGYIARHIPYYNFKNKTVFNPLDKVSYGIGYYGIGRHLSQERAYFVWFDMLKRCYDNKYLVKFPTYIGCEVCEDWHNYQIFADWYDKNYYTIENQKVQLDKDILIKHNKIYSPDTCVFLPEEINYIILGRNKSRGKYPIGVYLHSDGKKFVAQCHDINKNMIYLGMYDTPQKAFSVYKKYKEKVIKQVAEKYRAIIPKRAFIALYNYVVDPDD